MESFKQSIINLLHGNASRHEAEILLSLGKEGLDEYLIEAEWESYSGETIPEEWSVRWYQDIQKNITLGVRQIFWKRWLNVAAIFLLVASTLFSICVKKESVKPSRATVRTSGETLLEKCIINRTQEIQKQLLPDGSVAELYPGAALRFNNSEANQRPFWLKGEATFYVKKDPRRPFTVFSAGLATTALGTVFKVSAKQNKITRIVLIKGKIQVASQNNLQALYLNAGEECSYDPASLVLKKIVSPTNKAVSASQVLPIKETRNNNEMSFNKTPLQQVFREIEKAYGIHIIFSTTSSDSRTFTGTFTKTKTPDEVLQTIALLNDLEMRKNEDTVYLKK